MSDKLFNLSEKTAKSLQKYIDTKSNAKDVKKNMKDLLSLLQKTCHENANTDVEGYWENVCGKEGWDTLEYLQDDIGYYSDRWCYERYKTVERKWELLKEKIS